MRHSHEETLNKFGNVHSFLRKVLNAKMFDKSKIDISHCGSREGKRG